LWHVYTFVVFSLFIQVASMVLKAVKNAATKALTRLLANQAKSLLNRPLVRKTIEKLDPTVLLVSSFGVLLLLTLHILSVDPDQTQIPSKLTEWIDCVIWFAHTIRTMIENALGLNKGLLRAASPPSLRQMPAISHSHHLLLAGLAVASFMLVDWQWNAGITRAVITTPKLLLAKGVSAQRLLPAMLFACLPAFGVVLIVQSIYFVVGFGLPRLFSLSSALLLLLGVAAFTHSLHEQLVAPADRGQRSTASSGSQKKKRSKAA